MTIPTKGQLVSKAIHGLLTSPKKRTDEFDLFAFLLFTANKTNSSVRFLGESTAVQSAFRNYLTFTNPSIYPSIFSVTPNIQHYLQVFMLNENVIPRNQIEIVSKLSSGQFGYVYKGKSNSIRLSLNKNWTSQKWHSTCALINHFLN